MIKERFGIRYPENLKKVIRQKKLMETMKWLDTASKRLVEPYTEEVIEQLTKFASREEISQLEFWSLHFYQRYSIKREPSIVPSSPRGWSGCSRKAIFCASHYLLELEGRDALNVQLHSGFAPSVEVFSVACEKVAKSGERITCSITERVG